ncbi:hypothetical protein KEM52_003827 [Ascosphaera acerosa]|nr:hypothetical protein KEM52_003827 [Ascosphaera acerosa]
MASTTVAALPLPLPEGVKHYPSREDCPKHLQKYFAQRYTLFSQYDHGVLLTDEAWYGVTPEPIAARIALDMASAVPPEKKILVDAFAGVGGNTIAFAASGRWMRVYGIEKDPATLECAKRNAEVYGVAGKITWFLGDCFELLRGGQLRQLGDWSVVFASPPWGGPTYMTSPIFDLSTMEPYPLQTLHDAFSAFTDTYALYLPRTSDLNQLAGVVADGTDEHGEQAKAAVEHYCINGASKALVLYNGRFAWS